MLFWDLFLQVCLIFLTLKGAKNAFLEVALNANCIKISMSARPLESALRNVLTRWVVIHVNVTPAIAIHLGSKSYQFGVLFFSRFLEHILLRCRRLRL